ncbi:YbfB/YjiJ family MFS transporter [Hoeflea prorocentri]|uniref:YbfB/YjiJ family MFS transporter n=2 Tax=Hoeflea prorocentri TaxID=1922333 RepID=A0A9X3ZHU9_9HYPH|nr:YbfB/YjiJ family MFS transporter [Hoeflea prorocentri]MDA5399534.1 YbfB/YjiJ family MFS transporter [Hoeflea prorocentri]
MAAAMSFGRFAYTPLLPDLMKGLGLTPADAGLIASANYTGYLLGAIVAGYGWAAGRERAVFIFGLFATTILLAAVPFASDVFVMSAIRFASGVASAFVMIFVTTIILSHVDVAGRPELSAVHFSGVGLGIAVSAVLLMFLIAFEADWRTGWYATAVLALTGSVAAILLVRVDPVRAAGETREPPLKWDRRLAAISLAYGLFGAGYIVTATFLVAIVRGGGEQTMVEGWVWLVTGLAAAPSVFLWAPLSRRIGLVATFSAGCLVEAFGVGASVLIPAPVGPFVGGLLLGATFVAVTAYGLQVGRILAPQSPRRSLAIMTAAFGTGQIIGPVIAGYLADLSGNYTSGSLVAAGALVAAACLAVFAGSHKPGTQK